MSGDLIVNLPVDTHTPETQQDLQMASKVFGTVTEIASNQAVVSHFRPMILAGLIFLIFSLPQVSGIIKSFFSREASPYTITLATTAIFMVVLYFVSYYSLSRA